MLYRAVVIKKVEKDDPNVNLKQKRKGVKNKKLLSFEDEDTGEDGPIGDESMYYSKQYVSS